VKVFIGWSLDRSRHVAVVLRDWLRKLIDDIEPWVSETDIHSGEPWFAELTKGLEGAEFGIVLITQENAESTWMHFEAGALSNQVKKAKVCPYLLDFPKSTSLTGPFAHLQYKMANQKETLALLRISTCFAAIETQTKRFL
jgi:hypothetical protein